MKIRTTRDAIKESIVEWHRTYDALGPDYRLVGDVKPSDIAAFLDALDTDTCDKAEIDKIIGNTSWTENLCEECCEDSESVIIFERSEDYDTSKWGVCFNCLKKAMKMTRKKSA